MAIAIPLVGATTLSSDTLGVAPSLALLLLLTVVVLAVIYAYQPPLPQTMAIAFLPWVVTGSFLAVLAGDGLYPSYLIPLFTEPGAYLTVIFLPGLAWMVMLSVNVSPRELPAYHHYIGTMGTGAMVVLMVAVVLNAGAGLLSEILVIVIVPVVSLLAAGLVSLSIGLWCPDFVEYAPITGGFAIFGLLVHGVAITTSIALNGASHTTFSATVRDIVAIAAPDGVMGLDVTTLWVWLFLLANIAIGIHVATHLARFADANPRAVHAMLGIVGLGGFALGFNHLLVAVVG